ELQALFDELARVRAASADPERKLLFNPVKGDPFQGFAGFATHVLSLDTRLTPTPGATADHVRALGGVALDSAFSGLRAAPEACAQAFDLIAGRGGATVREVLEATPINQRRALELGLAWMAKYGILDWLDPRGS
ncbi:MAG: glycosyl transferase family 1, partial [Phenylobacterium sp.]|nr:glycosyl transferase family 1 [Phenylobacterium sp.]